jgi:hypothetical protein
MAEETTIETQVESQSQQRLAEPDPARRPARLALYVGIVLLILGGIAMYKGYDGAAKNALVQAQTPYVISGGLLGLGLLALGGITIALHVIMSIQTDFRSELNSMRETMERLAEAISYQAFGSQNGSGPSLAGGMVMVARGSTSFHRADCRLVERAGNAKPLPREEADREGLLPCRICKP